MKMMAESLSSSSMDAEEGKSEEAPVGTPPSSDSFVLSSRRGSVLGKGTILKSDHFPGAQNKKLRPIIEGAPNFRQVDGLPVYGVAIPTIDGICNVLKQTLRGPSDVVGGGGPTTASSRRSCCCWHNMREEPVLYINGKPFVLREIEHPFANVEYTGITSARVEDMEQRMKRDVLKEVGKFGGIMVCEETEEGDLVNSWEAVEPGDVQTPREVYEDCKAFGYNVMYFRIPVTDERSPKEVDFDTLTRYVIDAPEDAALIFNCQMGRGRTTTAMIVASLLQVRRRVSSEGDVPFWATETFLQPPDALSPSSLRDVQSPLEVELEDRLKTGDYLVIRSLLRVLEKGTISKMQIDAVIDACAEFQSLREGIVTYRERFLNAASEKQRNNLQRVVIDYLERYFMLITFTSYLNTMDPDRGDQGEGTLGEAGLSRKDATFKEFVSQRPELRSMRERLLWHNPLTAMEVHTSVIEVDQLSKDNKQAEEDEKILSFIALRNGSVLGSHTILKEDHYPGLQSHILKKLDGCPNFRRASDKLPVYGMAIPTEEGIRKVLSHIGITPSSSSDGGEGASLIWFNMREEPVIYLNGKPHALREHARPFKNMQEYSNISASRVESMEKRLKQDVLNEAKENDNVVLVTREMVDTHGARVINEEWEQVDPSHPSSVLSPLDIFKSLQAEGFPIDYVRIPVTDGKAPQLSVFDDIVSQAAFANPKTALVFNCQGGAGRTTTGMVIGSLLHLRGQNKLTMLPHTTLSTLSRRRSSNAALLGESSDYEIFDVVRDHAMFNDDEGLGSSDDEVATTPRLQSIEDTLKDGNYAAIQKLEHLLHYGDESKAIADVVIDTCGKLKNLRKAIFAYRKPRKKWGHSWGRGDESLQGRHAAFKNGIEYLERYFIIIAFASWLDSDGYNHGVGSFHEWFSSRLDLQELMNTIRTNPGAALSAGSVSSLLKSAASMKSLQVDVVLSHDHKRCLSSRSGVMLKRNTILKSYLFPEMQTKSLQQVCGVLNFFQAGDVPIASASAPSVGGMRRLLSKFKEESADSHVVVIDLREELVTYVKGVPYVLREIDFATKSLNLAGLSTDQVLQRESLLKEDLLHERDTHQNEILLHHEVSRHMERVPSKENTATDDTGISVDASRAFDVRADAQRRYLRLEAFWEETRPEDVNSPDLGICTPSEISKHLREEGFSMTYFRFPWSRERRPTASDVECLHSRVKSYHGEKAPKLRFLFLSHTGIGMGVRHIPVLVSCFYLTRAGYGNESDKGKAEESGAPRGAENEADENRGILALTRVIPDGPKCKSIVDRSISFFSAVGDMRVDIDKCKRLCESYVKEDKSQFDESFVATRLLGLNYLQRYFYSILYVCYLRCGTSLPFVDWFNERRELKHLLENLSF